MSKFLEIRTRPLLAERLHDRQIGHQAVMKALPDNLGDSPRAEAHCLWFSHGDTLMVQTDKTFRSDLLGELVVERTVTPVQKGEVLQVDLALSCLKTPPPDVPEELRPILKLGGSYRSRPVVVPEADRPQWAARKLSQKGFTPHGDPVIGPLAYASLGRRGGRIPYVEVSCTGAVTDADEFNKAVIHGIGKGKSFGLGLIRFSPAPLSTSAPA